jgi:hypothetical protein
LRAKGTAALSARLASLVGTEQELLVEKAGSGRTRCFAYACFEADAGPGSLLRARVMASDGAMLQARLLEPVRQQGVRAVA